MLVDGNRNPNAYVFNEEEIDDPNPYAFENNHLQIKPKNQIIILKPLQSLIQIKDKPISEYKWNDERREANYDFMNNNEGSQIK